VKAGPALKLQHAHSSRSTKRDDKYESQPASPEGYELHAQAVLTDLTQFCTRIRHRLSAVTLAEKQALLQLLIERIVVGTDTIEIQHVIPLHTEPTPVLKSATGTQTAIRRLRSDGASAARFPSHA
jgi:hypothetical protein